MTEIITADDGQRKPEASCGGEAPTTYYFISDLHIGGDGDLDQCDFETELIAPWRGGEGIPIVVDSASD